MRTEQYEEGYAAGQAAVRAQVEAALNGALPSNVVTRVRSALAADGDQAKEGRA